MDGKELALQESEDEYDYVNVNHEPLSFGIEYRILTGYSLYTVLEREGLIMLIQRIFIPNRLIS